MSVTVTFAPMDLGEFRNAALSDLGYACVGDDAARERVNPDLVGGLMYSGIVELDQAGPEAEFLVVSYGAGGLQFFVAPSETAAQPTVVDMHVSAQRNDDPALLDEIDRILVAWYSDVDDLAGDLMADGIDVYAR